MSRTGYTRMLSASRGAQILNVSKFGSSTEVFLRMKEEENTGWCAEHGYLTPEPIEYNASMRFGHAFESAICDLVSQKKGAEFIDREKSYSHVNFPFLTCHIDGRCNGILQENKTVYQRAFYASGDEYWGADGTDKIPREYFIQVMHQMIVTGENVVELNALVFPMAPDEWEAMGWEILKDEDDDYFMVFNTDQIATEPIQWATVLSEMGYLHHYRIERDNELIETMIELYSKFWNDYQNDIVPEPQDYDSARLLLKNPCGVIKVGEDVERLIAEYNDIRDEIKSGGALSRRQDEIKKTLLDIARLSIPNMDEDLKKESVDKVVFMSNDGKKLKQYSVKGGLR